MAKIRNFDSFGGSIPTFLPRYRSAPPCQISHLSGNVSPLRGEKPIFGPVSKNNTGMAVLRAGLPVIKTVNDFYVLSRTMLLISCLIYM